MHARERQPQSRADALDGRAPVHQHAAREGGRVKRLAPKHRGERGVAHEIAQLAARKRLAVAKGRAVDPRPYAPPRRRDEDRAPLRRQHPPDFLQQRPRRLRRLQGMGDQHPVEAAVRQRQHVAHHQRRSGAAGGGPNRRAQRRRRQRNGARRLVAERREIGAAKAEPHHRKPPAMLPARAQHAPDQPPRRLAQGRGVKRAEFVNVERHCKTCRLPMT